VVFCPSRYVFIRSMPHYVVRDRVRVRSMAARTRVYGGPRYLGRGPSPAELRIPRSALPERRVLDRRVIAEPQLTSRSRSNGRVQLESTRYTASRSVVPSRGRGRELGETLPSRSRPQQVAPRSYGDAGRNYGAAGRYSRPEAPRQGPAARGSDQRPVQRGSVWGTQERREQYRRNDDRRVSPSTAPQRNLPQRSAPAVVPRDRSSYRSSPYSFDGGGQRGAARGGERAAPPRAAPRPEAPRATRPAPDNRRRRSDDSSSGDSRNRGRERYGSGR
ncbi:MAG: hypothetical protein RL033_7227, partial [Pseudomonadota bacterium]